jgi:AcrR family transcriptional regulator
VYTGVVPKLWRETIAAHRREVRDAILEATVALVGEHGLTAVTMSQVAEATGIGRATLYKYFPDVEAILAAWHERQVHAHLEELARIRDGADTAGERLAAVLEAYARIARASRAHHGTALGEVAARLHRDEQPHDQHRAGHIARARDHLRAFLRDLLAEAAAAGDVRDDVAPDELASYCLHALAAAGGLPSEAAVRRLVAVTLSGLRPPADSPRGGTARVRARSASPVVRSSSWPASG